MIANFPIPKDRKELKRFIGLCSFYSETVPCLQYELRPLNQISGIKAEYILNEKEDAAFKRVKEIL